MMVDRSPLLPLLLLLFVAATASEKPASAYEVLRLHGLPIGIFPKGVTDFRFNDAGRFEVHLPEECTAKFETELRYDRNVTGNITYGQIAEISGVSAQELFLWLPVRGIRVDIPSSGLIYFDVGVIHKQFSLSLFEIPPECSPTAFGDHLLEDSRITQIASKNQLRKLRYDLDQEGAMAGRRQLG
ncbi:hypothetical protein HPP92_001209 [Vanilla planifolia]|uniref:Uncharacterized protein n=1 Tax=Vanilla planifolia TaxID=51239 RepID=A0A835SCJ0_VANPL|nr:hypothetical protein HPP92_001342 [Vanilla planifolia]KAG0501137.1 hypothetical protein HPP92_001209 [Vanilla planifolia]